jgi:hypothetical protein
MQDVRELLPSAREGRLELRCPFAQPAVDGGVPSVMCGAIEAANRREAVSAEVPALVSGRRSGTTIAFFCTGEGIPGVELDDETVAEIRAGGGMTPEEAHRTFSYTACQVFRDEHALQERLKREGHAETFATTGDVVRVEH